MIYESYIIFSDHTTTWTLPISYSPRWIRTQKGGNTNGCVQDQRHPRSPIFSCRLRSSCRSFRRRWNFRELSAAVTWSDTDRCSRGIVEHIVIILCHHHVSPLVRRLWRLNCSRRHQTACQRNRRTLIYKQTQIINCCSEHRITSTEKDSRQTSCQQNAVIYSVVKKVTHYQMIKKSY